MAEQKVIDKAKAWADKEYDELRYSKCEKKNFVFTFRELREMGKQAFIAGYEAARGGGLMTEARACIVAMFAALALFVSFIVGSCCIHDLGVMKRKLESMGASLAEMQRAQEQQAAENRQVKTDAEIILRLAAGGEFVEGEK